MKQMINKNTLIAFFAVICLTSCNDWLDVRPDTQEKEEFMFDSYSGFCDALTGCYISMADNSIYGKALTMDNIECMANLWQMEESSMAKDYAWYYFHHHNYTEDLPKEAIRSMYAKLFNVITQVNMIIKYADEKASVFPNKAYHDLILGEAYAMRAFCQFDLLRLFGQLPQGGTTTVMLPYSATTTLEEMPSYYAWEDYVQKLKADLNKAENLMKEADPFAEQLKSDNGAANTLSDDFFTWRRFRMNHLAVKGIQARLALYLGDTQGAHTLATELIGMTDDEGGPLIGMSGTEDLPMGYFACPGECLLALSKYDLSTYAGDLLIGGEADKSVTTSNLVISMRMLGELFAGEDIQAHNRYGYLWNKDLKSSSGTGAYAALKKYYYTDDEASGKMYNQKIIPLLRMSEIYLIAMETSGDLREVNKLFGDYLAARGVTTRTFASLDEARAWVIDEYRREFYGEGVMFYVYKRLFAREMKWGGEPLTEEAYILPLPESEYNPNELIK